MLNLLGFVSCFAADEDRACDRPVRVQLMQIQDGTSSFTEDVTYMNNFMVTIIDELKAKYGPVEFGLASYTDKPTYMTGSGPNDGVWKKYDYEVTDYCYNLDRPLSLAPPDFSGVVQGGGKDSKENQMEALYKGVSDPKAGWVQEDLDEEGNIVIKLAVLITDGPAHRDSAYDMDEANRNWYMEELLRGPCNYKDSSCTAWYGVSAGRTGAAMSLKGIIGHYNHFNRGNDAEMLTNFEYYGWDKMATFNEWRYCCKFYNEYPQVYASRCDNFGTWGECAKASCKECAKCDEFCADTPDYEADWLKDVGEANVDIRPFKYGEESFRQDCASTEYPDPFSKEYAEAFLKYNVTPLLFIRKPAKTPKVLSGFWPFGIEDIQLATACPIVGQRIFKYWLCYSDPVRQREGGISKHGGCDGYDPAELKLETFYDDCFEEHFGRPLDAMANHGVVAPGYLIVENDVQKKELLDTLGEYISQAIVKHANCRSTTAAPSIITEPITEAPITEAPITEAPITEAPITEAPITEAPITEAPITEAPITEAPITEAPITEPLTEADKETSEDESTGEASVGVIVGAAAGGLAGAAAIGAGLMAKGGIPGFSSTQMSTHIDESNIQNQPQQREQMTEIDANMFL